jgi:hypothetical protein
LRFTLISGFVIAIVLSSVVLCSYYFQSVREDPLGDEKSVDDGTLKEITILSWTPAWELVTCLQRPTGETNYDLDGFLNVTVNNPTDHRVRISLTVRYDYAFNYTVWGDTKTLHNSHKRTVRETIYEQWQRSYKFGLFYHPFDGDNPPNLHIIRFDVQLIDTKVSLLN